MNRTLLTILTLISINSFGQQWTDYKVDENLTVYIPDNFEVMDTLGQLIIRARVDNALIMIQRLPNKGEQTTNIRDKNELIENYNGFRDGVIKSQDGKLISQQLLERDSLLLTQFVYHATAPIVNEKHVRYCVAIFLNDYWYAVQFWGVEAMTTELTKDREMLFASIKLQSGQSLKNQMSYSIEGTSSYNIGYLVGQILSYGLVIGLLVALVRWISKRGKKKSTNAQQ